ncbi:MAG TPA: YCF48-related protein [Candidatus Binataceae bacterium]|nr:YCF48-related protein [Candidatus Binataceae bacterium]
MSIRQIFRTKVVLFGKIFTLRGIRALAIAAALAVCGCHREVPVPPLPERNVTLTDKFFDVWPTGPSRAFIGGARGKLLLTEDGGLHFTRINIGTDLAIFGIQMTDDRNGFLCGQDGLVMRTREGGKTWERLASRTHLFIFGLSFPDRLHGFLVGDRALVLSTTDGGESFFKRQLQRIFPREIEEYALPYEEPVLYSTAFVDSQRGWVVGELGRVWGTVNGGRTWDEEQGSLVGQWHRPLGPNEDARFADFMLPTMFGVSFRDALHGAACGLEGWVIQTIDGGKSWSFAHQADSPGGPPDTVMPGAPQIPARDPLFSIDLFGTGQGMTTGLTGTVLRLQPNGAWAHDSSVPALPFPLSQVRFFDDRHGWIVGYGTILYTEDGGKTWRFCQG